MRTNEQMAIPLVEASVACASEEPLGQDGSETRYFLTTGGSGDRRELLSDYVDENGVPRSGNEIFDVFSECGYVAVGVFADLKVGSVYRAIPFNEGYLGDEGERKDSRDEIPEKDLTRMLYRELSFIEAGRESVRVEKERMRLWAEAEATVKKDEKEKALAKKRAQRELEIEAEVEALMGTSHGETMGAKSARAIVEGRSRGR